MLKLGLLALLASAVAAPVKKGAGKKRPAPVPSKVEPLPEPEPLPLPAPAAAGEPAPAPEAKPAAPADAPTREGEPLRPPPTTPEMGIAVMKPASALETVKPRLVILEVQAGGGVDPTAAGALGDAITLEVQRRGYFTATSVRELQTALGIERQKQLLGCAEGASSCMAELADAIGARFVLAGSLTRLGEAYQLSLQTLDTTKSQPIGRSVRIVRDPSLLEQQLPYAVAEATATQLPPPPSKVLPYSLIIGGTVLGLAAGVVGLDAFSRQRAVQAELEAAKLNPGVLRTYQSYTQDSQNILVEKWLAAIASSAGAALIIGGVLLMPPSGPGGGQGGSAVRVVPAPGGLAVAGELP